MTFLSRTNVLLLATLAGPGFAACDLPQKDIGNESDTANDSGMGGACEPGDEMPADDGCNTCFCDDDGQWGCTLLGCDPTMPPGTSDSTTGPDPDTMGGECVDGDEVPAPDGCNTCFCENGQWLCTEIGCMGTGGETDGEPPLPDPFSNNGVHICDDSVPFDPMVIDSASIAGNELIVDLAYSGGCELHLFGSCWDGQFLESNPVQVQMRIAHDGMLDPCDAFPSEQRVFDLASLAEAYNQAYQTNGGTIFINLEGFGGSLEYTF
jgi:hypothetical protein